MEYKILTHTDKDNLENMVNHHLRQGWNIQGGIAMAIRPTNEDLGYSQALYKN